MPHWRFRLWPHRHTLRTQRTTRTTTTVRHAPARRLTPEDEYFQRLDRSADACFIRSPSHYMALYQATIDGLWTSLPPHLRDGPISELVQVAIRAAFVERVRSERRWPTVHAFVEIQHAIEQAKEPSTP